MKPGHAEVGRAHKDLDLYSKINGKSLEEVKDREETSSSVNYNEIPLAALWGTDGKRAR